MPFDHIRSTIAPFAIEHDNRHRLREAPHSREAIALMLQLPERGIAGFIYPWINADGTAAASISLFGPGLPEAIEERFEATPVPAEMDFYNWQIQGLSYRIDEPHRSADYSFAGTRVKIDCRFEAIHPVYPFSDHPEGCPQYYADDRTEQHGWIAGTMEIDGDCFEFRSLGQRDHAWGARIWGVNQHYKWFHATTEGAAIHFFEMQSFGTRHIRGFVFKEETMARVTGVECKYLFDEGMHHSEVAARLTDDLGRTTDVQAQVYAKFRFEADPKVVLNEGGITVTIEGRQGTGWCEFCWNRDYYEFAQKHVAKYPPFADLSFDP